MIGLLVVEIEDHDSRFVDPTILFGASARDTDDSVFAVEGRVRGFMDRGARNDSSCGGFCGITDRSDPLVPGREPNCSGGGLFGSSLVGGGCGGSSVVTFVAAVVCVCVCVCVCAGSFAGGEGGLTRERPSFVCVVAIPGAVGASFAGGGGGTDNDTMFDLCCCGCAVWASSEPARRASASSNSVFISRS